jgi:hypothetical protein
VASNLAVIQVLPEDDDDAAASAVAHRPTRCARPICPLATMGRMLLIWGAAYLMENNSRGLTIRSSKPRALVQQPAAEIV